MPKPNFVRRPMNKILEQKLKDLPDLEDVRNTREKEQDELEDTYDRFINRPFHNSGQEKA